MQAYTINIKSTTKPAIVKFEANRFLTKHESFEFSNIDEAGRSPLAQQLFHLPFVKTVYIAQNFVAIEKYNIVYWKDVQQEVADEIADYLNTGGVVVLPAEDDSSKKIPATVYAESTPNPMTMKFVCNKKLVLQPVEFRDKTEAGPSPIAQELFRLPFVKQVFMDENYLSISKNELAEWEEITFELREFLRTYLEEGKDILTEEAAAMKPVEAQAERPTAETAPGKTIPMDDVSSEIIAILEEYIKPAVASDGGNIMFESYDPQEQLVKVVLQGACSGCPSSTITLKNGIETMLKEMMAGKVERVEAING